MRVFAVAIVVLCTAVAADPVPFKTLDRGDVGGIERPRTVVVRTANEWRTLNGQRAGGGAPPPAVVACGFTPASGAPA